MIFLKKKANFFSVPSFSEQNILPLVIKMCGCFLLPQIQNSLVDIRMSSNSIHLTHCLLGDSIRSHREGLSPTRHTPFRF